MTARTRRKPAGDANVVPLRAPVETTDDIVRDVEERGRRQSEHISQMLQNAVSALEQRHRERVQECLPIGYAMSGQALADWLEIGRRMAGLGGRR